MLGGIDISMKRQFWLLNDILSRPGCPKPVAYCYRYLSLLADAFYRRFTAHVIPPNTEILVVSPGGVATTTFIGWLSSFVQTNDQNDNDGLKHRRRPPVNSSQVRGCIYVGGEVEDILRSLDRRKFTHLQAAKLGIVEHFFSPVYFRTHFWRKAINSQKATHQAADWRFLAVNYDEIWSRKEEIMDWVGAPTWARSTYPQRLDRASTTEPSHPTSVLAITLPRKEV